MRTSLALGALVLGACSSSSANPARETGDPPIIRVTELELVENPANVLSYFVDWKTDELAETALTLDCGPDLRRELRSPEPLTKEHSVFVMGLYPGASCTVTAGGAKGQKATMTRALDVGPLPAFLPELRLLERDADRSHPGWTLFNLNMPFTGGPPLAIAMVDELGRYRWYHQRATTETGADNDTRLMPEGVLVGGSGFVRPGLISWSGDVLWEGDFDMHHEIVPFGGGEKVLYLSESSEGCTSGWTSGVMHHYDRATDTELSQWRLCEHFEPAFAIFDWSHTNAIEPFGDQNAVLLSARNQHRIYKVDFDTGDIVWTLGTNGDFAIDPDAVFLEQHSPEVQPNGNVLVYDNGSSTRPWSRVVEYALDLGRMTASVVWEYRPTPDIFTEFWGDADRLPNGNTLVTFGRRERDEDSHLIEVTADRETVWQLATPEGWGWYRAERVEEPALLLTEAAR